MRCVVLEVLDHWGGGGIIVFRICAAREVVPQYRGPGAEIE